MKIIILLSIFLSVPVLWAQIELDKLDYSPAAKSQMISVGNSADKQIQDQAQVIEQDLQDLSDIVDRNPELADKFKSQLDNIKAQDKSKDSSDIESSMEDLATQMKNMGGMNLENIDKEKLMNILSHIKHEKAPPAVDDQLAMMGQLGNVLLSRYASMTTNQVEEDLINHPKPAVSQFFKNSPKARRIIARVLKNEQKSLTSFFGILSNKAKLKLYTMSVLTVFLFLFAYKLFFQKETNIMGKIRRFVFTNILIVGSNIFLFYWIFTKELEPLINIIKTS